MCSSRTLPESNCRHGLHGTKWQGQALIFIPAHHMYITCSCIHSMFAFDRAGRLHTLAHHLAGSGHHPSASVSVDHLQMHGILFTAHFFDINDCKIGGSCDGVVLQCGGMLAQVKSLTQSRGDWTWSRLWKGMTGALSSTPKPSRHLKVGLSWLPWHGKLCKNKLYQ